MKKIKTTDFSIDYRRGYYIEIEGYRFSQDEEYPFIRVELIEDDTNVFLDEIEGETYDHETIKRIALNWIFDNVEIVKECGLHGN